VNHGKKIAGVCAGIARHNEWDVTLVRVAFLAAFVLHGIGLLAYIIAWIAMPREEYVMYPAPR
jgi:phage shock protein PspC (stress-responsive transcriptional regulator)